MVMKKIRGRLTGASAGWLVVLASAAAAGGASASVPVDLRVAASDAGNLADVRQYVPAATSVKTYAGDDCFDPAPPFKQSSGASYPQAGPTMLSAIWEAGQSERALRPVRLSDADYQSFGALSVCQINAKTPPGFFFLKSNHQALMVGADLFSLVGGEELLAYRTPADFSADEELELTAPARVAPGVPITVNVRAYTNTIAPRSGAIVTGGDAPVSTGAGGNATVSFSTPGKHALVATGDYNDIPSRTLSVCVAPDPASSCPDERGREILGSNQGEGIKGTDGDDVIRPRAGHDRIKAREGSDLIIAKGGGADRVDCGAGWDIVKRDARDRVAKNCERVKGKRKRKHKHKRKRKQRGSKVKGGARK
jgi:hypothetical protein